MSPFSGQYCLQTALLGAHLEWGCQARLLAAPGNASRGVRRRGWTLAAATDLGHPSAGPRFTRLSYRRFCSPVSLDSSILGGVCVSACESLHVFVPSQPRPQEVGPGLLQPGHVERTHPPRGHLGPSHKSPKHGSPNQKAQRGPRPAGTSQTWPAAESALGALPNRRFQRNSCFKEGEETVAGEKVCREQVYLGASQRGVIAPHGPLLLLLPAGCSQGRDSDRCVTSFGPSSAAAAQP